MDQLATRTNWVVVNAFYELERDGLPLHRDVIVRRSVERLSGAYGRLPQAALEAAVVAELERGVERGDLRIVEGDRPIIQRVRR